MTPYFQHAGVTLYHGNALEVYPTLAAPNVVITDPPYGETRQKWDIWPKHWPNMVINAGSLWCWGSLRTLMVHRSEFAKFHFAQELIWEKQNGTSMLADRFRRVHELVAQFYPRDRKWADVYHQAVRIPTGDRARHIVRSKKPGHWGQVGSGTYKSGSLRLMRSVIRAKNGHRQNTHANAKPIVILRALVEYSCPQDGTVVDLFAGSANTLIAAQEVGRNAIGIEADEASCEKAARRLAQLTLGL